MTYADYGYYTGEYGGKMISEADFPVYSGKASDRIAAMTFGRLEDSVPEEYSDNVKRCCCELAECIFTYAGISDGSAFEGAGGIASETNGKYSVTFRSGAERLSAVSVMLHGGTSGLEDIYADIIRRHLGRTGLLYRGVDE